MVNHHGPAGPMSVELDVGAAPRQLTTPIPVQPQYGGDRIWRVTSKLPHIARNALCSNRFQLSISMQLAVFAINLALDGLWVDSRLI